MSQISLNRTKCGQYLTTTSWGSAAVEQDSECPCASMSCADRPWYTACTAFCVGPIECCFSLCLRAICSHPLQVKTVKISDTIFRQGVLDLIKVYHDRQEEAELQEIKASKATDVIELQPTIVVDSS